MLDPWPFGYLSVLLGLAAATGLGQLLLDRGLAPLPEARNRIGAIDGLRGYLALAVAGHHVLVSANEVATGQVQAPNDALFNNLGQAGVAVFFMITGVLFYAKTYRTPRAGRWTALYIGRVFRLIPLVFVIAVIVHVVLIGLFGLPAGVSVFRILYSIAHWTALRGPSDFGPATEIAWGINGVIWTLRYEALFYLSLPLLAAISALSLRVTANRWLLLTGLLALTLSVSNFTISDFRLLFAVLFVAGAALYELSLGPVGNWLRGPAAAIVGSIALLTEMLAFPGSFGLVQFLLLAVFFAPVVSGNSYFGFFSSGGAVVLGEISYGIYLWHVAVISVRPWFASSPWAPWILLPLVFIATVLVSWVTFRIVEKPGIELGRWLSRTVSNRSGKVLDRPAPTA